MKNKKYRFTPKLNEFLAEIEVWEQSILSKESEGLITLPSEDFKALLNAHVTMAIQMENILLDLKDLKVDLGIEVITEEEL